MKSYLVEARKNPFKKVMMERGDDDDLGSSGCVRKIKSHRQERCNLEAKIVENRAEAKAEAEAVKKEAE